MFCIRKTGYYIFNKISFMSLEMRCSDVLCVWKLKVKLSLCTSEGIWVSGVGYTYGCNVSFSARWR